MKPHRTNVKKLKVLAVLIVSVSINAQNTETHFSLLNTTKDSSITSSYYSTIFYEKDIDSIYHKLDSIFSILDSGMLLSISVTAIDADSMGSYLQLNSGLSLSFNGITNAVFERHKPADMDNRVKDLIQNGRVEEDRHIGIEQNSKLLKSAETTPEDKHVREILLSDADILIKAGVSSKIITAPALKPTDAKVHFKVISKNGKQLKTVDVSLNFEERRKLEIKILDKNGRVLFEEIKKKFSGTYQTSIDMRDELSPYYFVAISDKRMFGRMFGN